MSAETASSSDSTADEMSTISGINITPFVDVVLVLLVIFMVTAPILSKDIFGITLPKAANGERKILQSLGVSVTKQGQILLNGELASADVVIESARAAVAKNPDVQALISADSDARHGDVVKAIDLIKSAGLTHFAFQIEKP